MIFDLKIHMINLFIIIYIIKSPTNCIPIMSFLVLLLSMKCLKGFFHFIVFTRVCYFLCCILFSLKATIHILIAFAIHFHHQLSSHFHFDLFPFLTKKLGRLEEKLGISINFTIIKGFNFDI